ncbi:MAG TPA: TonB-dependent receptor [Bryobacteraceae bacterium]
MTCRKLGALSACLLVAAALAFSQEFRGRIQGVVTDSSGAVAPGVTVILKNTATGVDATRTTNEQGRYVFDYVDPGTYSLSTELTGFKRFIQQNILVQQRGDVTVDVKLEVGALTESVSVDASPVALELNTSTRDLTIETKMVRELPSNTRNPWQLAALDPTIINRGSAVETQPYHHRTANEMDLGGGTKYRNDALLDGTPLIAGNKLGYTPSMDSVTEYTVQQNSVDAEFGHSAGGVVLMTMKSGTNDPHGTAYFFGRNASWNAITDRAVHRHSDTPYWNAGGTLGAPIIKNKLFVFAAFDKIENTQASSATSVSTYTLPTTLERGGDFSQSLTATGALRVIYDPTTTTLQGTTYVRTPFPKNAIPVAQQDAAARKIMNALWAPNNPGDDATGLNNFKYLNELNFHYYNFSVRTDYHISDKWKVFGRVSRFKTDQDQTDFTNGQDPLKLRNVTGSKRNGWNIAGDTVYMISPTMTLDLRGAYYAVEDKRDYPQMSITESDLKNVWPNVWWQDGSSNYLTGRPLIYFPHLQVESGSYGNFGVTNFWYQQPNGYSGHARLTKYYNKHYMKAGMETRWKRGNGARFYFGDFQFVARETGRDYSRTEATSGHAWASFLLGADDAANSNVRYTVLQNANTEMYGFYFQDDYKVTQKLTLNLGLRYEYEGGLWDPQNRIPQRLDLTDPIPGMAAAVDPLMPADVKAKMAESAGQKSFIYNGNFYFTEEGNKHKTSPDKWGFMPRVGLAWRLNDKSVVRVGYGRFIVPASLANPERDTLGEIDLGGFTPRTNAPAVLAGIPQSYLANPFPFGLDPITGKTYGRFTNLGSAVSVDEYEQRTPISDRINVSIQRQLPGNFILDGTYFVNFVSRDQFSVLPNLMDPRLSYTYKSALSATVNNPFYNYGTPQTFPGSVRNNKTVAMSSLLVPYPQYGVITQTGTDLRSARYQSFQIRGQRAFANGFTFLATYAYVTSRSQWFFDTQDQYDNRLTWYDFSVTQAGGSGNPTPVTDPKHRFVTAATWDLPVGHGRHWGANMPKAAEFAIGGWQLSGIYTYTSGAPLLFSSQITAPADSVRKVGCQGSGCYWFDTTGFAAAPSFTRRVNPWYYDGLNGPGFKNIDLSLTKKFAITEHAKVAIRMDAFNAFNGMNWATPQLSVTASDFGKTNTQLSGYFGRQLQFSAHLDF